MATFIVGACRFARRTRAENRGQVLPLVALSLVVLTGMAAFAVDIGYVRFMQRAQQIATDSAAIGGASELLQNPATRVTSGALMDAASNGYTNGAASVTVTVNNPPTSGAYNGVNSAVEVIIDKKNLPVFFAGALGVLSQEVKTRAVAAINPNALACVYALQNGIRLNGGGGGGVNAPTCGIVTNGDLTVNGGSANVDARFIGYTGTFNGGGAYPEASPTKLSIPVADPCGNYPSCLYLENLTASAITAMPCLTPPASGILSPGHYCGTISGNITLSPTATNALFVFDSVPTGNMTGNGATIYNNAASTGVTWNGNITVNVSAPTTGPTAGMVYFQRLTNTGAVVKNGNSGSVTMSGGFYAPGATVTMNGNVPSVSLFVAASIVMNGGGMNVASSPGLTQVGHAVLAE